MKTDDFLSLHERTGVQCCCVYFLKNKGVIVYIGSTNRPHVRVYEHTRTKKVFDDVSIMTCSERYKLKLEGELIREHAPLYNKFIPKKENQRKAAVALNPNIDQLLKEIVKFRVDSGSLIDSKIKVVADLIMREHKKVNK